jgi:hypothetical protein
VTIKRIKDHDLLTWESCEMSQLKKGDVFYEEEKGLKGTVLVAACDALKERHPSNSKVYGLSK